MENQKKKLWTKFIANFMILVMIAVSIPMEGFAEELNNLNSRLQTEELTTKGDEKILKKTEDKTIYQLDNGLKREVLYDGDVRYFEDGKLVDYDPSLIKIKSEKSKNKKDLSNYAYENKQGDKKNYLPNKISEETPILLENDKYSISINSVQEGSKKVSLQKDKITDIYDEEKTLPLKAVYELDDNNTTLEYVSQDNGIKENIIFNSVPKSNEIKYELTLENVIPKKCEVEESIVFYDKNDEKNVVASIDPPFMNDKTEKAYSEDITYDIEKKKNEKDKYILTITIDEKYLNSSDRVYPVKLDPTITWTGDANLIDTYILSNSKYADVNFYLDGTTAFPIGYSSSMGTCRSLIKSPNLFSTVRGKYVENATLTMYETSSCDANMTVNAYRIIDDWNKSTVTWNNKPRYNTSAGIMGTVKTTGTLYKARVMDITTYARVLANGTYSSDKGLMLKTNSDSSSSAGYCKFFGSRHSSSSLRPRFTVEYYDGPTIPSSVKLSKTYFRTENTATLTWSGIETNYLDHVEYRISRYDDETKTSLDTVSTSVVPYTQIGTTSSGSGVIPEIATLSEGCYRIIVRGIDTSGVKGPAKGYSFHLDNTNPVINSVSISPTSSETNKIAAQDITVSLNITEKHLKNIQYRISKGEDEGEYKIVDDEISNNSTFIIPKEEFSDSGKYDIDIRAIDKSNKISQVKSLSVYIDKTIPEIGQLHIKDSNNNQIEDSWTTENTIKVEFSDLKDIDSDINTNNIKYALIKEGSTVKDTDYIKVNNVTFTHSTSPYAGYFSITPNVETGAYDLYLKVEDKVGNISTKSVSYKRDTISPTASIDVENSDDSTNLNHTIKVIGNVNDVGSGIKDSNVKLYKLNSVGEIDQESNSTVIYDNSTTSVTRAFDTRSVENGQYRLVLYAEDGVGHSIEKTKDVTIVNKIEAPEITTPLVRNSPLIINWKYTEQGMVVSAIQYKLENSNDWQTIETNGSSGSFNVALDNCTTGIYKVHVRAIDRHGFEGIEEIVECEVDQELPTVAIQSINNGILVGTATDKNFSKWEVYIKRENEQDTAYTKLLESNSKVENNTLGVLNLSSCENGNYIIKLVGIDEVGNESSTTSNFTKSEEFINAEVVPPKFILKRPFYQDNYKKTNKVIFSSTIETLEAVDNEIETSTLTSLARSAADGILNWYNVKWYIGNQEVGEDFSYSVRKEDGSLNYNLNQEYKVSFAVDELFYGTTYNMPLIKNKNRINVNLLGNPITGEVSNLEKEVNLEENVVSFRLTDTNSSLNLKYEAKIENGEYQEITPTNDVYIKDLSNNLEADKIYIRVSKKDGSTFNQDTNLNDIMLDIDVISSEYFTISSMENYRPINLSVKDKVNYKTYVKWEIPEGTEEEIPEDVYYEVYRGRKNNLGKINYELAANNIKTRYWTEPNINYAKEFYYKVRAVRVDSEGNIIETSSFSKVESSKVVDSNELTKNLGIKEFWEYAEIDLPNGDVSIEKSKGNLVYQQVDAVLPNEQLEVNLTRTYNNQASSKGCFGIGWCHEYDIELLTSYARSEELAKGSLVLKDSEGTIFYFNKQSDGSYISSMGKYINIYKEEQTKEVKIPDRNSTITNAEITKTINSSYTMRTKDGVEYLFNSGGQLVYLGENNGNFLLFDYDIDRGLISKITTSKNISMEFIYYNETDGSDVDVLTVKEVRLPDGSKVNYNYTNSDGVRLSSVVKNSSNSEDNITYNYSYDEGNLVKVSDAIDSSKPLSEQVLREYQFVYDNKKRTTKVIYPQDENLYAESIVLEYSNDGTKTTTKKFVNEDERCSEEDIFDSSFGNCIESTDAEGYKTTYSYDSNLLKNTIYEVEYQTLENGEVQYKKTTKTEKATYDSDERVTTEIDEDGTTSTYNYDSEATVLSEHNGISEENIEVLESLPTSLIETDEEGNIITNESYSYDEFGNTLEIKDEVTNTILRTTYTEDGEIASETEILDTPLGERIQSEANYEYIYESNGNKKETVREIADGTSTKTITMYDVMGKVLSCEVIFTESDGTTKTNKLEENTYDSFGRLTYSKHIEGDKTTETTRTYYPNGTIKTERVKGDVIENNVKNTKKSDDVTHTYTYDKNNRVKNETISRGDLTKTWTNEYSYENITINTGKGTKEYEYSFVSKEVNPDGEILGVTYQDALGRTIREKENGVLVDLTYDKNGNILTKYENGINSSTDESSLIAYLYDSNGNQTTTIQNPKYNSSKNTFYIDGDNTIVVSKVYDSQGNVIEETDGEGYTTKYEYDAEDRIKKVTLPEEGNVTNIEYDVYDNADGTTSTIVTDANGNKTRTATNSQDLAVYSKNLGDSNITPITSNIEYDSKNNVTKEIDSKGNFKEYEYDDMDRNTAINYFDENGTQTLKTEFDYDILGNIIQMRDYKVSNNENTLYRVTAYDYDNLKRVVAYAELSEDDLPNSNNLTNEEVKSAINEAISSHKITYTYDINDKIIDVTYPTNINSNVKGLHYEYNSNEWLTKIYAKVGTTQRLLREYSYKSNGNVDSIKDYKGFISGNTSSYTLKSFTYDKFDRTTKIEYTDSSTGTVLEKYEYTYNKNNFITSEKLSNNYTQTTNSNSTTPITNESRRYEYDKLGRLTDTYITNNNDNTTKRTKYTYDKVGNRLKEIKDTSTTEYTYNSLNQLLTSVEVEQDENSDSTSSEDEEGTEGNSQNIISNKTYQYDGNGNQTRESDSVLNEVKSYTYDADNRMSKAMYTKDGTTTLNQENTYNGSGQRVTKSENGQSTNYYYQDGKVLYTVGKQDDKTELEQTPDDYNIKTGITSLNLMETDGEVISSVRDVGTAESYYFYNKDLQGSTTNVLNAIGQSEVAYEYTDFGETETKGNEDFYNEIAYTGEIYDDTTGLYYLNSRYYNPEDGRFITEDTYAGEYSEPSSLHLYAYCQNNPVNNTDPTGNFPWALVSAAWDAYDGAICC